MVILGINGVDGIFHDASASLVVNGTIVASVEEERFNRRKHSSGIPFEAISYCLRKAGIDFSEVDHIGYYLQPEVLRKTCLTDVVENFGCDPSPLSYIERAAQNINRTEAALRERFPFGPQTKFHFLNHHITHAASAYYVSGFDVAAILTIDGSGDRESSALFQGRGPEITKVHEFLIYPDSLGYIYTVFAAHLGLNWISGPGKLMGLAGYGQADRSLFADIVRLEDDPVRPVRIDLSWFEYHLGGAGLSRKGQARFGAPVPEGGALRQSDFDLAASVQQMLEGAILHLTRQVRHFLPEEKNLCLSGGVALNVTANRRILDSGLFEGLFVTPPAYDGGTSLGCALYLDAQCSGRNSYLFDVYLGPDIEKDYDIQGTLTAFGDSISWQRLPEAELIDRAAVALSQERFVGWVQGRMECGPRALGNRSILANPIPVDAKDRLNAGIKKRESFRPYAPSVLREECEKWFDLAESPHMLFEATVRSEKRSKIPAVVHIDGSSRPQTVTQQQNPRYYKLIRRFYELTGVPMLLNTSFNQHGEPIVNRPEEAIAALLATELDDLFIGDYHARRNSAAGRNLEWVSVGGCGIWKGWEIPDLLRLREVVSHNESRVLFDDAVRIYTRPTQWSYAAAFRLNRDALARGGNPSAMLFRIGVQVETGRLGFLFVADDLQTVVGEPTELALTGRPSLVHLLMEPAPSSGWLIVRNNAADNQSSACVVTSLQAFRASYRPLGVL